MGAVDDVGAHAVDERLVVRHQQESLGIAGQVLLQPDGTVLHWGMGARLNENRLSVVIHSNYHQRITVYKYIKPRNRSAYIQILIGALLYTLHACRKGLASEFSYH